MPAPAGRPSSTAVMASSDERHAPQRSSFDTPRTVNSASPIPSSLGAFTSTSTASPCPPPEQIAAQTKQYEDRFLSPFVAAERGYIDDVILPRDTRARLCRSLAMLSDKVLSNPPKKHDNIPL